MKQKIGPTVWPTVRLGIFILSLSFPPLLAAQEDNLRGMRDSMQIRIAPENSWKLSPFGLFPETIAPSSPYTFKPAFRWPDISLKNELHLPYHTDRTPLFQGDYRTGGIMKQMPRGAFVGSAGQTSVPGIGRFNTASFGYRHVFDQKLALALHANAMKINMARMAGQVFSVSGDAVYRPAERIAFRAFGSYDLGNSYGMSTHYYGATVAFDMSERFGMEVGVQRYYNTLRGNWETVPVAIPYYRFDKFKLGFDVGGLLYEILRNVAFDKNRRDSGPTIAPPRLIMPMR